MNRIERFASEHPVTFGFIATVVFILMLVLAAVLGNLWPGEETYGQPGGILGRLISIIILLAALSRLGWLRAAGFLSLGRWSTWLINLLLMVYIIAASTYAMTGSLDLSIVDSALTFPVTLFILVAAFLEEVVFRGLILHGFVRAWGKNNRGLITSVVVSSLLFCSIHLLDFLSGRPITIVLLQSLQAFFLGVFLSALVLSGKSIYPAAIFHVILNLAAYQSFASRGLEPGPGSWLLLSLFMLPLAVFALYFLTWRRNPGREVYSLDMS